MSMIDPPYEEIKVLKEYADKHDMALGSALDENCIVILLGKKHLHVNEVAIICAFMLLQGILNGSWNTANERKAEENEEGGGTPIVPPPSDRIQ